jgi:hypothetical protein
MKKVLMILLVAFITTLSVSSCTEEQVQPKADGLGSGMRDKI